MQRQELNVGEVIGNQEVDLTIKSRELPDERASRLKLAEAEAAHQRQKDFYMFVVTIGVVIVAFCASLFVTLSDRFDAEMKKMAIPLLTLIVGGLLGYLTGKSSK